MRVITGSARGRKLMTMDGNDVRPTTDKVKESIFSIIQFQIPGSVVLDLFAGSGQLGIEALSRGASKAFFIDKSKASINVVSENIAMTEFEEKSKIVYMDSIDFLRSTSEKFDIAFLDPPYRNGLIEQALPLLESHMNDGGRIICEHEERLSLPEKIGSIYLKKNYKYGKIEISQFVCGDM